MTSLTELPLKNNLKKHNDFYTLLNLIVDKIQRDIPELTALCVNGSVELELVNLVCNLVENAIPNGNILKIDKKSLVLKVLTKVFSLAPVEVVNLSNQIDYLYNNNKIKKLKLRKKAYVYFTKVASNIFLPR